MAELSAERSEVRARILYWGPEGAGTSTNLEHVARKLRSDHRGELRRVPTALDPTAAYEVLPIALGEIAGTRVQLEVVAVPGAPEHAPTRKQLLDRADGVVLVVDASPDRLEADLAAFDELRRTLGAYGRSLGELPLVVQYNKCDRGDELTLEELHRKLDLRGVAVFEAVAHEGRGVLPTLTTISKRVIRHLREGGLDAVAPRGEEPLAETEAPGSGAPAELAAPRPEPAEPPADPAQAAPPPEPTPWASEPADPAFEPALEELDEPEGLEEPETLPPLEAVEAGILAEERDPEAAAEAEALARRAEAQLGAPWETPAEPAGHGAAPVPQGAGSLRGLRLAEVGTPRRVGDRDLVVPLELEDGEGHRVAVRLAVSLDLLVGAGEEGED